MDKFNCQGCGLCCTEKSFKDDKKYPHFSENSYVFYPNKPTLSLFDWEAKKFAEEAMRLKLEFTPVPYRVVVDMKGKRMIVLQYTFKEKDCMFLKDNRCMIYDNRALVCKFFPVQIGGVPDLMSGQNSIKESICPDDYKQEDWLHVLSGNIDTNEFVKKMHSRYGDAYLALLERDLVLKQTMDWVQSFIREGMVEFALPDNDPEVVAELAKNFQEVPLSVFMRKNSKVDMDKFIANSEELKHAKAFVQNVLKVDF